MSFKSIKYRRLISRHKESVYYYAFSFLKNEMDAEDVSQEVWIRVWNNLDSINWSKAKSWILKTTHNLSIDTLRKKRMNLVEITDNIAEFIIDSGGNENPQKFSENESIKENIEEAIALLPEKLRMVFILYQIEGFKYREISEILKIPINSTKVYLMRARKELQKILQPLEEDKYE